MTALLLSLHAPHWLCEMLVQGVWGGCSAGWWR